MEVQQLLAQLARRLPEWYINHARTLPWRADREPYHVWLSEIMLQQTRVEAVKGYYVRFLSEVPDIAALAQADPELLNKLWEGLGYYSRVRNLQAAAKQIMTFYHGVFPVDYQAVRQLKGIGDYTAGAICSICFEQPTPAVDGNVLRVVTRLCADPSPVSNEATKKRIREALAAVYPVGGCGIFTQSLMELGATVCLPNGAPRCEVCPMEELCSANLEGSWNRFPVKEAKKPRREELLTVFVMECDGAFALRRRPDTGLLAGLWEFPNVPGHLELSEALRQAEAWQVHPKDVRKQTERSHIFTHVQWRMRCYYLRCGEKNSRFTWVDGTGMEERYALPTAFRQFREQE